MTHIGSDTTLARWMKEGKWHPEKKVRNGGCGCCDEDGMEALIHNTDGIDGEKEEEEGQELRNIV